MASIGAQYVSGQILTLQEPISTGDIRAKYQDPRTLRDTFDTCDLDSDGVVSLKDLSRLQASGANGDPAVTTGVSGLIHVVSQMITELQLGAGGEQVGGVGVRLRDLPRQLCNSDEHDHHGHGWGWGKGPHASDWHDEPDYRGKESSSADCPIFPEPPESSGEYH